MRFPYLMPAPPARSPKTRSRGTTRLPLEPDSRPADRCAEVSPGTADNSHAQGSLVVSSFSVLITFGGLEDRRPKKPKTAESRVPPVPADPALHRRPQISGVSRFSNTMAAKGASLFITGGPPW